MSPLARVLSWLVIGYRRGISPLLGSRCRFEPTCSSYALEALHVHGAIHGSALIVWRLLRCQPFGTPGYDPVPDKVGHIHRVKDRVTGGTSAC
jgi:putative membrane protein insertion efficiency factor